MLPAVPKFLVVIRWNKRGQVEVKCTRRYFKVRDDDLSSNQGSLSTFKIMLIEITQKYFEVRVYTYNKYLYFKNENII